MYNSYTKYNLNICVIVIIFNFTLHIHMLYISIHITAGFIKCLNFDVKGSTLVVHLLKKKNISGPRLHYKQLAIWHK